MTRVCTAQVKFLFLPPVMKKSTTRYLLLLGLLITLCSGTESYAHSPVHNILSPNPGVASQDTIQNQAKELKESKRKRRKAKEKSSTSKKETEEKFTPEKLMRFFVENNDTVYVSDLPPAYVFDFPSKGKDGRKWREFYRTVHNFAKTYPYALVAKARLDSAETYLATHELSGRELEKYLSNLQNELFKEFEEPLRKLTFSQGRMLLRLIDREIGITSYYIIREYRGRAAAGFWQGIGSLFGADLKKPYDRLGQDKELEELVELYNLGQFDYLYYTIFGRYPPMLPVRYHDIVTRYNQIN